MTILEFCKLKGLSRQAIYKQIEENRSYGRFFKRDTDGVYHIHKKYVDNFDILEIAKLLDDQRRLSEELWNKSMKVMNLTSKSYKTICKAGLQVQKAQCSFSNEYDHLRVEELMPSFSRWTHFN